MNPFIARLRGGGPAPLGIFLMSGSPIVAEAIGCNGFEWAIVDAEHSPIDVADVAHMLMAIGSTPMLAVVRAPWNEPVIIKRLLDAGAATLLVPFVQDAEEAARAAAAVRYPPQGLRGMAGLSRASRFGAVADHFRRANAGVGLIVQIETPQALDRIEDIAAVEGVDAVFIGPTDLSGSMGLYGDGAHPDVQAATASAIARCKRIGKPVGTLAATLESAAALARQGADFVVLASDLGLLLGQVRTARAAWKTAFGGGQDGQASTVRY
ncbi:aldolase/citrate lyase family protein [Pigmentiphaga sp.]|uniref:HpcH/HpaI aldolase family protein n=1 Tax=Pigmentiphaga sp. TaxID=1977564 RepID=UPI00128C1863|nr:aldolase/citrate lyase family protein [Pigmentiphaga sp.]MPS28595.1 2-dehydro-3-deoxyglucarate aldolase [Alcaligenaceae bacterium SAGV5]MPS54235.1 2-dehydro-3-deoxyglucarate aldolase [Alcaligenaceae bacterium SAGV3]MPT55722.1 2-dehydro-3-deoxyglucarate aldolase [Alcaligenaceae bacterium]